ncbi:hypothetical protein VNI00_012880 [Paramarasmius palmivorus]|uniref:Uncharacterized protein n=1 Tax=Paramarasmius palmivorus TaxID=297713 RepID=A0AAW0C2S1_9AGAR
MTKWDAWLSEDMYYWSFDPSGAVEIPDVERLRLGLPSFVTTIEVWHNWWDCDAYEVLEMLHRSRLFDPGSTELARLLGWTILDIVGGWCCSDPTEEVGGSLIADADVVDDIMDIDNYTLLLSAPELSFPETMITDEAPLPVSGLFDDAMEVD